MISQISRTFSSRSEDSKFDTTRVATRCHRLGLSALALCYLAIAVGSAVLPCSAEIVTSGVVGGAATGSVVVATPNSGWDWAGLPQNNPDQITVNSTSTGVGQFDINLNFTQAPSTEYGITWTMVNSSGADWYSMHFTYLYAPLGDFSVTFDQTGANPSTPGNNVGYGLDNWTDANIDFSGSAINGVNGTATFYIPLDVFGKCCGGNFHVFANPDYSPQTPEPNTILLVGSGILGFGGFLRRKLLG